MGGNDFLGGLDLGVLCVVGIDVELKLFGVVIDCCLRGGGCGGCVGGVFVDFIVY